ncbi:piggyBac transposable element-derived protein 4-like [Melitaea cinxia]|uniref:piggyBac transposable element-derived protein 4-like n=1 Tax=Melitaea cinxia TaxID=113334 RepID=UPI001E26EAAF|nr:piggyBac transposable element-derived protein 4-like [Melitaea cinxia]
MNTDVFTIFRQIVNDKVLKLMVEQTNIYGRRLKERALGEFSRIKRWTDVTEQEMLKFLGMVLFTGLVKLPTLESYWKKNPLYFHPLMHNINLSYNRYCILLKCWHFADNEAPRNDDDRLYKIKPLVDLIMENGHAIYTPGRVIVVDKSMVHFRGRLCFRQYIPSKAHKYGVKIYKLCTIDGFVWEYEIYYGISQRVYDLDLSGSIVARLAENLLDEGRLIITDNFYTSVPLANFLKTRRTDLLGTVNKMRRGLPQQVTGSKLKKGEIAAMQKGNITVLKWHDKRDVLLLSTCNGK